MLAAVAFAIVTAKKMYTDKLDKESTGLMKLFENKWYVDEIYQSLIIRPTLALGRGLKKYVEKQVIEKVVAGIGVLSYYFQIEPNLSNWKYWHLCTIDGFGCRSWIRDFLFRNIIKIEKNVIIITDYFTIIFWLVSNIDWK